MLKTPAVGFLILVTLCAVFAQTSSGASVNWTDSTGFWDVAGNWSSNPQLPGATDDVIINVAGLPTVTYRTGTNTISSLGITNATFDVTGGVLTVSNSFSNNSATNIISGSLRLNGAPTMASLNQTGGTLSGAGTVTAGTLTWSDGTMGENGQGGGTTTVTGTATIDGTATYNLLYYGRTLNLNGGANWSAGNGEISIYSGGQGTSTLNVNYKNN